jgi:hypothetical protein
MYILASDFGGWGQFAVLRGVEAKPGIVEWKGILAQSRPVNAQLGTDLHNLARLEGMIEEKTTALRSLIAV